MEEKSENGKKGKIQIVMDRKFSEFKKEDKNAFEKDLSEVVKTDKKKIKEKKYKRGCVFFEGELDQIVIDNLIQQYESRKKVRITQDSMNLDAFVNKYSIKQIFQKVKFDVITSKKSCTTRDSVRINRKLHNSRILDIVVGLGLDSIGLHLNSNMPLFYFGNTEHIEDKTVIYWLNAYLRMNSYIIS